MPPFRNPLIVRLGTSLPCQVMTCPCLYRGVPTLTAIDPSLQHTDSTTRVF
jgi:hypothetical protein